LTSLDTNVVVRALTQDEPTQAKKAAAILERGDLYLTKTVLVEVEWVLRKAYDFAAAPIHEALVRLVALEGLTVEDRPAVLRALEWHGRGLDFADALHVASSAPASSFVTFDGALAKRSAAVGVSPRVERR